VHRTAGGLRVLSLIQARKLVPFRWLVLPAAGNAGRWAANAMKKYLQKTFAVIVVATLLMSCSRVESFQPSPSPDIPSSPTVTPLPTLTVVPTITPITLDALNHVCVPNTPMEGWETSPNGKWMATGFYSDDEKDSLLQVVRMDCAKVWKVALSKYRENDPIDHHDIFIPERWSRDGKFLYADIGQRMSGCCWKGLRSVILVRLDLETGEQTEILSSDFAFDFIISDSDRYIAFTPPSGQPYDFAVLDQETQKIQEVTLEFRDNIDLIYAVMSPHEDKIVLPLFQNIEYDSFFVDSIALVDLTTGNQELLVSGLTQEKELYPVRWADENHVLLSNIDPKFDQENQATAQYWLLNIDSHKLEETEKP
jgi:hypothetical protein